MCIYKEKIKINKPHNAANPNTMDFPIKKNFWFSRRSLIFANIPICFDWSGKYWTNRTCPIFKLMKVRKFMIPLENLIYVTEESTIKEATDMILKAKISSLLVIRRFLENGQECSVAMGLITKSDLIRLWKAGGDIANELIGSHLNKKLIMVYDDEDRVRVAELMVKNGIHHIFVANKLGEIVGLVSSMDLAREWAEDSKDPWRRLLGIRRTEIKEKFEEYLQRLDHLLPDPNADSDLMNATL
jgi:CBS domain-containing protein